MSDTWRLLGTMKSYVTQHRIRIREFGIVLRKTSHPPSTLSSIFKAPNSLHFVATQIDTNFFKKQKKCTHKQAPVFSRTTHFDGAHRNTEESFTAMASIAASPLCTLGSSSSAGMWGSVNFQVAYVPLLPKGEQLHQLSSLFMNFA